MRLLFLFLLSSFIMSSTLYAADNVVNLYTWSGVLPTTIIRQFEKETGIKVNFSTYDSNEVMFGKLKADKNPSYDIVEPSSYYIDRMRRQNMLEKLDKNKLSHFANLNPAFLNQSYDPASDYSIPFIWGITGIFVNTSHHNPQSIHRWTDLWSSKYVDQLMLLDDSREVFSMALSTLGYSVNDNNPEHIFKAYQKLKTLLANIKIFNSSPVSILIDEDATIGMVWNGDLFKAKKENPQLAFIYPTDGFVIWVDNFAIPKNAPHKENAYKLLNFLLRAEIAKAIALDNNFATANLAGQNLLPDNIKNNPAVYPPQNILHRGEFQTDLGDDALALYEKYWEQLKIGG